MLAYLDNNHVWILEQCTEREIRRAPALANTEVERKKRVFPVKRKYASSPAPHASDWADVSLAEVIFGARAGRRL